MSPRPKKTKYPRTQRLLSELKGWCDAERGRRIQIANLIGVSRQAVSAWFAGTNTPTSEQILWIQEFLNPNRKTGKTEPRPPEPLTEGKAENL